MDLKLAKEIREFKKNNTFRSLSEYFGKERGTQHDGIELCKKALKTLYPNYDIFNMPYPGAKFGKSFDLENLSGMSINRYKEWVIDGEDYSKWREYKLSYWWE